MKKKKEGGKKNNNHIVFLDAAAACGFYSGKERSRVPAGGGGASVRPSVCRARRQILITTRHIHGHAARAFGRGERTKLINSENPPPTTLMAANPK